MKETNIRLFTGNANPELARKIAAELNIPVSKALISRFSDVEIQENVRGREVYLVQPTCSPANEHIMEFLIMADALRRASVNSITAVIPYYGYARQDRRV